MLPRLLHKPLLVALVLLGLATAAVGAKKPRSLYEATVPGPDGKGVALASYKEGKPVVLVVNVASQCGFTDSNYRQLQALYDKVWACEMEFVWIGGC
jgi:hypothetical protein